MQSRGFPRRGAALVVALALLLATPTLAAPVGAADTSWLSFEAIWSRLAGALGVTAVGTSDQTDAPVPIDRVTGSNGQHIDPDGEPESAAARTGRRDDRGAGPGGAHPHG